MFKKKGNCNELETESAGSMWTGLKIEFSGERLQY